MRTLILASVFVLIAAVGPHLAAQTGVELVSPTAEIPREAYKTWSLFLVCNPDWVAPEKSGDLAALFHRFESFGDSIGDDNLAVWFWKKKLPVTDSKLASNVDVARSATFCRALQLPPSRGPYVIVTTAYPDVKAFPKEHAVFELGGLPPAEIAKLLNKLTDQLLLQNRVAAPAATPIPSPSAGPAASPLWVRLLEGARQSIVGFGCQVKLQVDAGPVKAEVRGCTEH